MLTRPSLHADGHDAYGPGAVATAGCVRGNPHVCGDTRASTGDAGVASDVGSLFGWPGNRDQWPFWRAATGLFWPAGRPCSHKTVGSWHGDSAQRDTGSGHSVSCGSWLPPARSRLSRNVALTGRIRTTTKADAEGNTRLAMREAGEEKLRGQFSERCPWFTFSPVILAYFLAGDNTSVSVVPSAPIPGIEPCYRNSFSYSISGPPHCFTWL